MWVTNRKNHGRFIASLWLRCNALDVYRPYLSSSVTLWHSCFHFRLRYFISFNKPKARVIACCERMKACATVASSELPFWTSFVHPLPLSVSIGLSVFYMSPFQKGCFISSPLSVANVQKDVYLSGFDWTTWNQKTQVRLPCMWYRCDVWKLIYRQPQFWRHSSISCFVSFHFSVLSVSAAHFFPLPSWFISTRSPVSSYFLSFLSPEINQTQTRGVQYLLDCSAQSSIQETRDELEDTNPLSASIWRDLLPNLCGNHNRTRARCSNGSLPQRGKLSPHKSVCNSVFSQMLLSFFNQVSKNRRRIQILIVDIRFNLLIRLLCWRVFQTNVSSFHQLQSPNSWKIKFNWMGNADSVKGQENLL